MEKINFLIDSELKRKLKVRLASEGSNFTDFFMAHVERYLMKKEAKKCLRKQRPDANKSN